MSKSESLFGANLTSGKLDNAVPLPAPATTASYNLTPGAYTQFLFRMNEVKDVAFDQQSGALKMNLANGSTILVQNFKDLARSAETCGRDTVLQFMRDETLPTGQTTTKIVNIAPDILLKSLDPSSMPDGMTVVSMPPAGVTHEVVVVPGGKYRFDFDWANAAKTEDGTNVMLSFKNGGLVILRDFVPVMQGDLPAKMSLSDGTVIDASKLIVTACTPTDSPIAKLASIEPASGERHAASTHPHRVAHKSQPDVAQKLANIEPAAGDGTPGQSGNRGSAGFSSGIDDAALNGLGRLGGLGPTSLTYGIPRLPEQIVLRGDQPAEPTTPPVIPPPVPTLTAQDARVYEDGRVGLSVTTTAPAGTTTLLTISGFPAGWIVNPESGTFDPLTRTWSISVPAGATFTGGPVVHPSANADVDISKLDVRAVATDTTTGLSSSGTEDIRVITDAVADTPDLSASITNVAGMIANLAIATAPTDLDGSEQITAVYVGPLPVGVTLDKGVLQNDGRYLLNPADLSNVHVIAPTGYNGTVNFNVTSVVTETRLSDTEFDFTNNVAMRTVPVSVNFVTLPDGTPTIGDSQCDVDESIISKEALWATGNYNYSYGPDGAGSVTLNNFAASGSLTNGVLSSGGVPVVVTTEGNDFVGRAGSVIVFKLMVDTVNGTYRFEQYKTIDHADGSNPNDVIALDFGIKISDVDGDTDTGVLRITIADDAPIARDDAAATISGGGAVTGNVVTNDMLGADQITTVTSVTVNGVAHAVGASGTTTIGGTFGTLVIGSTGAYTYTAHNGANGGDVFTYTIRDFDGDTSQANLSFGTSDGVPTIGDSQCDVDESIISKETLWATGDYTFNYGSDGAGSVALNNFVASGSLMNGTLSSGGIPITVTTEGNSFIGRAGSVLVFKMDVNTVNATYRFEQYKTIDHANGSNPDDVITLDFGIKITDSDGDTDTGNLRITIKDDGVTARDDAATITGGSVVSGNVVSNDYTGADVPSTVTSLMVNGVSHNIAQTGNTVIDGAFGSLTIAANGAYSYAARNGSSGGDVFTYTLRDFDGDTSSAKLTIGTADGVPTIGDASGQVDETNLWTTIPTVSGQLNHNFGADGAGTIVPSGVANFSATGSLTNGQLTMGGLPVVVTLVGNTYKGQVTWPDDGTKGDIFDLTVNADGSYVFHLHNTLDHANGTNPNDVITLNFGVKITDADGDTDTGVISINVLDDAPIARDDSAVVNTAGVATGNVINNDYYSDDDMQVTSVTVNGVTMTPPDDPDDGRAILVGTYGTFSMDSNGVYTYTARNGMTGSDILTYTLTDIDGDTSTARLTVGVNDGIPTIGDDAKSVDETNLGPIIVNGALAANYGADGAGSITARANSFSATGSLRNGSLTAQGQEIAVTLSGNTWTGSTVANGMLASVVLFTLVLHNDGTYAFTLNDNLDHANASDSNDTITLNFGAVITDRDGDTDTGTITINVVDDAPIAHDDVVSASFNHVGTGNVLANDISTEDPVVTRVVFNNVAHDVVAGAATVVAGDHGTLAINQNGHYTYTPYDATTETICINPVASDVAAANDSDLSRNGITITAINPNTGVIQGDLTWISGDLVDGYWNGEQGVGIAGSGSNFINGTSEGMRIKLDTPQDDLTITISGWNSFSDKFTDRVTELPLHARVYLDNGSVTTITLTNGWDSGYGLVDYTLTAAQFGGRHISSVEVFSTQANADWNLYNVSYDGATGPGTDTFQYTATDRDGDASTAFLNATNTTPLPTATGSAIEFTDHVQAAINDYVTSTTDHSVFTSVQPANDIVVEQSAYLPLSHDDLNGQIAA